jgi:hypothetical protein
MTKPMDNLRKLKAEFRAKYRKSRKERTVSYTLDEFKIIERNACVAGISTTEFIHDASLSKRIKPIDVNAKYKSEIRTELRRIGHNINQIAKALNNRYLPADLNRISNEILDFTSRIKAIHSDLR